MRAQPLQMLPRCVMHPADAGVYSPVCKHLSGLLHVAVSLEPCDVRQRLPPGQVGRKAAEGHGNV